MLLKETRQRVVCLGVAAVMGLVTPGGTAMAATPSSGTAITIVPAFASTPAPAPAAGTIELAQNNAQQRRLRKQAQRDAKRKANKRVKRNTRKRVSRNTRRRVARNERRRIYRNGRWYTYRNGRYYDNSGAVAAAGIVGLAAGAIAGAAIAGSNRTVVVDDPYYPAPYTSAWYRDCSLKYLSFRASDGTFLGYDGLRRTCRLP